MRSATSRLRRVKGHQRAGKGQLREQSRGDGEDRIDNEACANDRQPEGDGGRVESVSFSKGQSLAGRPALPLGQVPAAMVASRTKRATLRVQVRMSPRIEALALLGRPYQGERFSLQRA